MNIFYLNSDPERAAQLQYNKHVVKMILESAQLLCSAHIMLDSEIDVPYKLTHKNHPSAVWVRASRSNYAWLYFHMMALGKEYKKRYNKEHLTISKSRDVLSNDSVAAYRNYYINEKAHCANTNKEVLYTCASQFE